MARAPKQGGNFIKKATKTAKKVNKFAKRTKVVSKGLKLAGEVTGNKKLTKASATAAKHGYGAASARRAYKARQQKGGNFVKKAVKTAKKIDKYARKTGIVSKSLGAAGALFGQPELAVAGATAAKFGYGARSGHGGYYSHQLAPGVYRPQPYLSGQSGYKLPAEISNARLISKAQFFQ